MAPNNLPSGNNNLKTLVDKLINDCKNHIKKSLEENDLYDIYNLKNIPEDAIIPLSFESSGRYVSLKPYKKTQVRIMSAYIR